MKISQQLKEKNIAEYLIYMWQVEDLLRANKCDIDLIRSNVISRYPAEEHAALEEWYGNLADMMRAEGVTEKGHLQINRNVIRNLTDLHADLLASTKYPFYNAASRERKLLMASIALAVPWLISFFCKRSSSMP